MYTKLLIKIESVLLTSMTAICIAGLATGAFTDLFANWTSHWAGLVFLGIYIVVFIIAILQIILGLMEGKVFGMISGTFAILSFIPFMCFVIIPINIYLFLRFIRKDKQILHVESTKYKKIKQLKKT